MICCSSKWILSVLILCSVLTECLAWSYESTLLEDFSFRLDTLGDTKHGWNDSLWKLEGSAEFNGSQIVLTSDWRQIGSVWHRSPLDATNWEAEVEFRLVDSWLKGDGFGFLYTEKPEHGRAYGAALNFTGLVVAVDTYQNRENEKYPTPLTVQIFNGSQTLNLWADGIDTAVLVHSVSLNGEQILRVTMKIRYQDYALTVWLTVGDSTKPDSYGPFRIDGVYLPRGYYLGFGAFSGDFWNAHSVTRFEVWKLDGPEDTYVGGLPRTNLLESIYENPHVAWDPVENGTEPSNGIVLDFNAGGLGPVYFARAYQQGRYVLGLYDSVTGIKPAESFHDLSSIRILSFRESRDTLISWVPLTAEHLGVPRMLDRLVTVGYSAEGELLYICKVSRETDTESPSRIGVFSLSAALCMSVDGPDSSSLISSELFVLITP